MCALLNKNEKVMLYAVTREKYRLYMGEGSMSDKSHRICSGYRSGSIQALRKTKKVFCPCM